MPAPESPDKKALRVAGKPSLGARYGYLGGMNSPQGGMLGTMGRVCLGLYGVIAGTLAMRQALATATQTHRPYALEITKVVQPARGR